MKRVFSVIILIAAFGAAFPIFAQSKAKKPLKKTNVKTAAPTKTQTVETAETQTPEKKNERAEEIQSDFGVKKEPQKKNQSSRPQARSVEVKAEEPRNLFVYEFTQPDFLVSHIVIQHDENGKGTITLEKREYLGESFTDPIQLSAVSLERIKNLFQTLNFLDSTEVYQSNIRQYPHLGTMKICLKADGRERAAEFNWTENKDAKALADEYRKISQQFVWMFDISVSLANQPLEAPGLMDQLDSLLRRNEISDPPQMVPLLKKLSDDERIPLIARNHAMRMVKDIEKKFNGK